MTTIRRSDRLGMLLLFWTLFSFTTHKTFAAPDKEPGKIATIAVSPEGNDNGDGTLDRPFLTLEKAQRAVRAVNKTQDVVVSLADGMYRLSHTLVFSSDDGGQNGHKVTWAAADGAHPVLSGAIPVKGWKAFDKEKQIFVAPTPVGLDSRQLWINDELAKRTSIEIKRADVSFTPQGIVFKTGTYDYLSKLPDQDRMEVDAIGFFTDRVSPIARIEGRTLTMKQPAWNNNIWGYDTLNDPYGAEFAQLFIANSLGLLAQPGQWYLDPKAGRLYVRPPSNTSIESMDIELPRLTTLMAIGTNLDAKVENLEFRGIRFSHTTWLGPSSEEGFASQQSGSYIKGNAAAYPADVLKHCSQGCQAFETLRNQWNQVPASIQVAAARLITFDDDVFAHLGQYALGIGNDADANNTGAGLGTSDVHVERCTFNDDAGGAVLAGGVRPDAHHPSDPRMINRALLVSNNQISAVSKDYMDNAAILSTYVSGALILHNDISDVPYDAIDIGYGWGYEDAGGNANYRVNQHGYDVKENPIYETSTTHHDVVVANNKIHGAKKLFHDGGAIYNLSAGSGTLITENYVSDNNKRIALYLDEGSRYITVRKNVVDDPGGTWLNINTAKGAFPLRITVDNTASGNWHNGTKIGGMWTNYQNDLILEDHHVNGEDWPAEAQEVMRNAGLEIHQ